LTDEIEKVDQYTGDDDADSENDGTPSIHWFLVVRAYLGKPVQVQRENLKKKKDYIFHWRDPWGDQPDEAILEVEKNYSDCCMRAPPPSYVHDSVEVMCTRSNPEFSKDWAKLNAKGRSNTLPFRFKEYMVPFHEDRHKEQLAVEYIVGYVHQEAADV